MPIEIKELIIKTTVRKNLESEKMDTAQLEKLKQDILRSCEKMIRNTSKKLNER